jgi:ABC superfamily ATP binding cassette transporter permease (fragment)
VLRLSNPFDARYFIPIVGILLGNMLGVNVLSLSTYYQGLQRERQLYFYLLGNGATRLEALTPFIRQAIEKAFVPCIANMAVMGLVSFPGTMIGQILGGSTPDTAVRYQILISCITFCAPMLSLIVTLYLGHRYSFDKHGCLLNVLKTD